VAAASKFTFSGIEKASRDKAPISQYRCQQISARCSTPCVTATIITQTKHVSIKATSDLNIRKKTFNSQTQTDPMTTTAYTIEYLIAAVRLASCTSPHAVTRMHMRHILASWDQCRNHFASRMRRVLSIYS